MASSKSVLSSLRRQAPSAASCKVAGQKSQISGCRNKHSGISVTRWHSTKHLGKMSSYLGVNRHGLLGDSSLRSSAFLAPFSTSPGNDSLSDCARDLSVVGGQISNEGGADGKTAMGIARLLSPSARKEIAEARKKIASEGDLGSEKTEDAGRANDPDTAADVEEPSKRDLRLVAINQAIPFVGFGLMDNAILIIAGDAIDHSLGVLLGISTLCAAALGNIISDLAGVMLGTAIEDFSAKLGLPVPNICAAQRQLRSVRFAGQFGCAVGITIGCIVGMFPLLFIDTGKVQKMKQEHQMDGIFRDMVTEVKGLIGAQSTCLFLVVDGESGTTPSPLSPRITNTSGQYLYGKYVDGSFSGGKEIRVPLGRGIASRVALTGEAVNVYDARTEPDFDGDLFLPVPPEERKNMICVPVFDSQGSVIAVIQALNKIGDGTAKGMSGRQASREGRGFNSNDLQVLQALATHVSVSLQTMHDEDDEKMSLSDTIQILKEHGASAMVDEYPYSKSHKERRLLYPEL